MAHDEDMYAGYDMPAFESEEWWLATPVGLMVWADFRALDGMDDEDALAAAGVLIEELQPPQGQSDEELLPQMIRQMGPRH